MDPVQIHLQYIFNIDLMSTGIFCLDTGRGKIKLLTMLWSISLLFPCVSLLSSISLGACQFSCQLGGSLSLFHNYYNNCEGMQVLK